MAKWSVCVMALGGGTVSRSVLVRYDRSGERIEVPYISLAATDGTHKVVIDTGAREVDTVAKPHAHRTPDEELPTVLHHCMGWTMADVDLVINTHLHYDHCGGNHLFPCAQFYVQRREWEAAHNLSPSDRNFYQPFDYSKESVNFFRWEFLDGDAEPLPGLRLLLAPGHTHGMQMVMLDTEEGTLCFPGDVVPTRLNLEQFLEPEIVVDSREIFRSMELVRRCADRIVLSHDHTMKTGMRDGLPTVPSATERGKA